MGTYITKRAKYITKSPKYITHTSHVRIL